MKKVCIFLFIIFAIQYSNAQNVELSGTIVSELTEEPISGVRLVVDSEVITYTDANGSFSLLLLPGNHKIRFKMNEIESEFSVKINNENKDLKWIKVNPYKENKLTFD